jgi:ribosomal protein L11 methyltransferase
MSGQLRIVAEVEGAEAALEVAAALDELAGAVAAFEVHPEAGENAALWRVEAYPRTPLLDTALEIRLALLAAGTGGKLEQIIEERLPERDWLLENRRVFPPLQIGRFFVHGSHWRGPAPPGTIAIEIDAATAFGTGEHPSTRGCLLALDDLARSRRFRRPLDIGTGSGVLAIAAARAFRRRVLASDIDAHAVRIARDNARLNGSAPFVRVCRADGLAAAAIRAGAPFDLVFANILLAPLQKLAGPLTSLVAPRGRVILSGLLNAQANAARAAYPNFKLERRIMLEGWTTLVLKHRSALPVQRTER